jgi:hypothetical protein
MEGNTRAYLWSPGLEFLFCRGFLEFFFILNPFSRRLSCFASYCCVTSLIGSLHARRGRCMWWGAGKYSWADSLSGAERPDETTRGVWGRRQCLRWELKEGKYGLNMTPNRIRPNTSPSKLRPNQVDVWAGRKYKVFRNFKDSYFKLFRMRGNLFGGLWVRVTYTTQYVLESDSISR